MRDSLGESIEKSGDGPKGFIADYRERTRQISEMTVLQSYKLTDETGDPQLAAVKHMVADLENQRANDPGSRAQDISEKKMADLYHLIDHWDDPRSKT